VTPEVKGPKLEIGKLRRRKNFRRHTGHRQRYTAVKITGITVPGLEVVKTAK
jgi:large subunit ribosomal protein L21